MFKNMVLRLKFLLRLTNWLSLVLLCAFLSPAYAASLSAANSLSGGRMVVTGGVAPNVESIQVWHYPLSRILSVILNIPPSRHTRPALQASLDYAC